MYSLCCTCEVAAHIINETTTATTGAVSAAAAMTTVAIDNVSAEPLRLRISPRPNDNGQLVRAVGSSVVMTCQRINVDDDDDELAVETPTIEWLDKNAIRIPEQTSSRYIVITHCTVE